MFYPITFYILCNPNRYSDSIDSEAILRKNKRHKACMLNLRQRIVRFFLYEFGDSYTYFYLCWQNKPKLNR